MSRPTLASLKPGQLVYFPATRTIAATGKPEIDVWKLDAVALQMLGGSPEAVAQLHYSAQGARQAALQLAGGGQ